MSYNMCNAHVDLKANIEVASMNYVNLVYKVDNLVQSSLVLTQYNLSNSKDLSL